MEYNEETKVEEQETAPEETPTDLSVNISEDVNAGEAIG